MGLLDRARNLLSSTSLSERSVIWAFDVAAGQKPIGEYDLIVMLSDETDLPIFLRVEGDISLPEGALAYRSTDDDWAMEVNNDATVPAVPCKLIPQSQTDEVDVTRPDVIEVPDEITGSNISPSEQADDAVNDDFYKIT